MSPFVFKKQNSSQETASLHRGRYFLLYTLAFLFLSVIVFSPFWLNEKSLIWKPDGLTQHFNSLVYFANWGRSILQTLITEHRLSIPLWDFSIGYGSDILTTLHYYVIGDPLNLLALVTPVRYMETLYNGLILLRMYLAGLAFSSYCFYMKRDNFSAMAGTLTYVFCGYAVVLAPMHPYFINPMIYLPLLLLGIEKVFQKEKGHLLIAMVALSAISNFYFFYMLVILVVIYCIVRFCTMKHLSWGKDFLFTFGRTLLFSLTGTAIAAGILLPIFLQFASDRRSDTSLTYPALYDVDYYEQFLDQFVSLNYSSNWTYLGFTALALLCVCLLFLKRRKYPGLKLGFVLLTAMLLIPAVGSFMNGFSYTANRWSFGYSFLIAAILTFLWPELFSLSSREKGGLILFSFLYMTALMIMRHSGSSSAFFSLALMMLAVVFVSEAPKLLEHLPQSFQKTWVPQVFLLVLLSTGIISNGLAFYRMNPDGHLGRFVDSGKGLATLEETASGMMSIFFTDESEFSRYAQEPVPVRNDSLNHDAHSIHYYWSLSNGAITQYFDELALPIEERAFKYSRLDYRSSLHALAGVRYYVRHDPSDYVPYLYTGFHTFEYLDDAYFISTTEDYLPFGYTYDYAISRETYESLPYLQRQQAFLQGAVCDGTSSGISQADLSFVEQQIPYEISYRSNIIQIDNLYYATEDGAELTLTFDSIGGCETYLLLEGLNAQAMTDMDFINHEQLAFYFQEDWEKLSPYQKRNQKISDFFDSGISRFPFTCTSELIETDFAFYAGLTESSYDRSDFLINMGYSPESQHTITLTLPYQGVYSFQNLSVLCLPVQNLPSQLAALKEDRLEQVTFGTNQVSGTISLDHSKLLCLSIPYSTGWSAYVDGQEAPLLQANTMYMALELDAGDHTVELRYQTPGLKHGIYGSLLGLTAWILYFLISLSYTVWNRRKNMG